jgi:predicted phosphodiesterase
MRIAVISDVHGNLLALDAVVADIHRRGVDLIVNLGDLVSGALQPAATADRLIELDLVTVRGNHERQVLEDDPAQMGASDLHAHGQLTDEHRRWMSLLPLTAEPAPGVLAFHGTPTYDTQYLLDTVGPNGAHPATRDEVLARLGEYATTPLLLSGHTHIQRAMRLANGSYVLNPGSVGLPAYSDDLPHPHVMEAKTPHARYAIADDVDGTWRARFFAVDYAWDEAAALAESNGRPDWARALRTGSV